MGSRSERIISASSSTIRLATTCETAELASDMTVVSNPDDSDVFITLVRPLLDAYCDSLRVGGAAGTKDKDGR